MTSPAPATTAPDPVVTVVATAVATGASTTSDLVATPRSPATPTPAGSTAVASASSGRLRNGELRRQIACYLAEHPGDDFTPGQIARALDRSSGAVGNALLTLAGRGEAQQTATRPVRYRATATTATAATSVPTSAPRSATNTGTTPPKTPATSSVPSSSTTNNRGQRAQTAPVSSPTDTPAPHAKAAATTADAPVTGPVPRPNGTMYHPRLLSGMPDVTALRKLRAAGIPALLYGPPGTGKTSVIEAAFPDLVTISGDVDTVVADLVGDYVATPSGGFQFVHGPLVTAMREGRCLFLDDATLIPPSVLAVLYPAMDGRGQIVIKANAGEVITAAPGFYVVAGHNPGVHGAVLSDALSSRFSAQIQVSTDLDLAQQLNINRRAVRVAHNLATRQEKGEIGWAPQLRELIAFDRIAAVLGPEAAAGNLVGIAPEEDRDTVSNVVRAVFGSPVTPLRLGTQI